EAPKSPFVFVSERGGPFTTDSFKWMVKRAGQKAGFPFQVHAHMLRHAAGYPRPLNRYDGPHAFTPAASWQKYLTSARPYWTLGMSIAAPLMRRRSCSYMDIHLTYTPSMASYLSSTPQASVPLFPICEVMAPHTSCRPTRYVLVSRQRWAWICSSYSTHCK